jgi:hypothetical protein
MILRGIRPQTGRMTLLIMEGSERRRPTRLAGHIPGPTSPTEAVLGGRASVPPADREPSLLRDVAVRRDAAVRRRAAIRRALAGLLVALLAALTPVLSAAPAGAARASGRTVSAPTAAATAHGTSTGQQSRRGLRPAGHRSPGTSGRRVVDPTGAVRPAHPRRGGTGHQPTGPASSSIDATGPPSSYPVPTVSSSQQRLGGCHHPAAAGRAPPTSSGS